MAFIDRALERLGDWASREVERGRTSRRVRRVAIIVTVIIVLFGLFGVFGVPAILRHVLTAQVAQTLHRPVTVGDIAFNPYRLRLEVDKLHIGDRDVSQPFVDIGHLHLKISWKSLFRLAPIVTNVAIDHPDFHVIRTGQNQFNFSDLLEHPGAPPPPPPAQAPPMRFAISNIQINDGSVYFDDQVLNQKHSIQNLHLQVPFVANLPADVDVFVQPLLQMKVDGSPFRLDGMTKPFGPSLESIVNLDVHALDLARYVGYVPVTLPVKLDQGKFSSVVQLHFVNSASAPHITLDGEVAFDAIDVRDLSDTPAVAIKHASISLKDVEPLEQVFRLGHIRVSALVSHIVLNADGTTNLTPPAGGGKSAPTGAPVTAATPSAASTPSQTASVSASSLPASVPQESPSPNQAAATPTPAQPAAITTPAAPVSPASTSPAAAAATPAAGAGLQSPLLAVPQPSQSPVPPQSQAVAQKPQLDFSLDSLELDDSAVDFTDRSHPVVASAALNDLRVALSNLHTLGDSPAAYEASAKFGGGGSFAIKGNLAMAKSQATTDFRLDQLNLAALKAFAEPYLAGEMKSGELTAKGTVRADFAPGQFNAQVAPASASLDNFNVLAPDGKQSAIAWKTIAADIGKVDLAARTALINQVRADGIRVFVSRDRSGQLNLAALARTTPQATPSPSAVAGGQPPQRRRVHRDRRTSARRTASRQRKTETQPQAVSSPPPADQWRYQVASVAIEKTQILVEDASSGRPVKIAIDPLNLHLRDISNDLRKPISLDLDAAVNRNGLIKVSGTAVPSPLETTLRLNIRRLDLSPIDAYIAKQSNAKIVSAALTMGGVAEVQSKRDKLGARYRGDVTLGNVRMLDRLTGDNFVRWSSLSAGRIDAEYGSGVPKVHIGQVALSNFYARAILDPDGRLNVTDIAASPQEARKSLTREGVVGAPPPATPTPTPTSEAVAPPPAAPTPTPTSEAVAPPPATAPKPLPADIAIDRTTLQGGHINYTDDFIKPNYTADLTDVGGSVGTFGTAVSDPAPLTLEGQLNGSAPISITGSINPLVPMAFVDITAKADGVELTGLTPYSAKYTGYPIVKGTLKVDVHYLLDHQKLTANNHIYIDQLTFGEHVADPNAKNLPVRLAVALLSDSRGVIDLNIPVSGSLNDPQFSISAVIWAVVKNLVVKALTSPFSLIASAFGGHGAAATQDLSYIDFQPGYATLTSDAQGRLQTIANALQARPALKLEISGRVDPTVDRDGLRNADVEHLIEAQKIKDVGASEGGAPVKVDKDEYDKYLTRAYKAAKFPKPRDFVGLAKSLPPDEMKKLMLANVDASDDALRKLADARADAVRKFLTDKKVDPARLSIVAPRLDAKGIAGNGKTSRVDLSLK